MMRTWTVRGLVALLTLAVAVPALRAAPPSDNPTIDDKLTELLIQQQKMQLKLNTIQATQDVQLKSMQDDIDRLKDDLRRLGDEVRRLSVAPAPSIAASINPAAPAGPLVTSDILLENRYVSPATVYINGQAYRLNPYERRSVPEPVGRFTYSVYTDNYGLVQGPTERFLSPTRDYPITINP